MTLQNRIITIRKPKYSKARATSIGNETNCYDLSEDADINIDGRQRSYYLGPDNDATSGITKVSPIRIIVYANSFLNVKIYGDYVVPNPDFTINEILSSCKFILL